MTNYTIRKAKESDKSQIAHVIAYSFEKDFSGFANDMSLIAKVFEKGIDFNRFLVAEQDNKIVGVAGCADCTGRALSINKKDCRKYLGFIRGSIAFMVFKEEFMLPLLYPVNIGNCDIIGVLKEARNQGIGKALLEKMIEYNSDYSEFIINVIDINKTAIKIYENFGFKEFERIPYKWAKQSGFKEKIWMRYTRSM